MAGEVQEVTLESLGKPEFTGRTSDIYPWEGNRLLKLFFQEIDPAQIELEYANTIEAHALGCTTLEAFGRVRAGDRTGIILSRVAGDAMSRLADKQPWRILTVHKDIARVARSVNEKHSAKLESYPERIKRVVAATTELDFLTPREREILDKRIAALPEGDHVVHLDFHTENILHDKGTNVVIDWMTAARSVPAADIASTWYLFTDSELSPTMTEGQKKFYNAIRRFIVKRYRKYYTAWAGIPDAEVEQWILPAWVMRLCQWHIDSERPKLQSDIKAMLAEGE
jgi:hypothetical protein